jgi:hypothetical protein
MWERNLATESSIGKREPKKDGKKEVALQRMQKAIPLTEWPLGSAIVPSIRSPSLSTYQLCGGVEGGHGLPVEPDEGCVVLVVGAVLDPAVPEPEVELLPAGHGAPLGFEPLDVLLSCEVLLGGVVALGVPPGAEVVPSEFGFVPLGFVVLGVVVVPFGVVVGLVPLGAVVGGLVVPDWGVAVCAGGVAVWAFGVAVCVGGVAVCGLGVAGCAGGVAVDWASSSAPLSNAMNNETLTVLISTSGS